MPSSVAAPENPPEVPDTAPPPIGPLGRVNESRMLKEVAEVKEDIRPGVLLISVAVGGVLDVGIYSGFVGSVMSRIGIVGCDVKEGDSVVW